MRLPSTSTLEAEPRLPGSPGRACVVFASDPRAYLDFVRERVSSAESQAKVVAVSFEKLPDHRCVIDHVITTIENASFLLWPDWYRPAIPFATVADQVAGFKEVVSNLLVEAPRLRRVLSLDWLKAASERRRMRRSIRPRGFSNEAHAAQLALTLDSDSPSILLVVTDLAATSAGLFGLSRAAEHLATTLAARLVAVLPAEYSDRRELDAVNHEALLWENPSAQGSTIDGETLDATRTERKGVLFPIIGRPHPLSTGEQLLASRIEQDPELSGRFEFNVVAIGASGDRYLVDVLWRRGLVVVEIDGYEFHSDRSAFSRDRSRDHDLTLTGHLTLRIPHDEVIDDVEIALEKVRSLVRYRERHFLTLNEEDHSS